MLPDKNYSFTVSPSNILPNNLILFAIFVSLNHLLFFHKKPYSKLFHILIFSKKCLFFVLFFPVYFFSHPSPTEIKATYMTIALIYWPVIILVLYIIMLYVKIIIIIKVEGILWYAMWYCPTLSILQYDEGSITELVVSIWTFLSIITPLQSSEQT